VDGCEQVLAAGDDDHVIEDDVPDDDRPDSPQGQGEAPRTRGLHTIRLSHAIDARLKASRYVRVARAF
jgi:hypothetical protein